MTYMSYFVTLIVILLVQPLFLCCYFPCYCLLLLVPLLLATSTLWLSAYAACVTATVVDYPWHLHCQRSLLNISAASGYHTPL